jgi:acyl-CoA synthetase (AMP-forming)/AMP-acid ligase II
MKGRVTGEAAVAATSTLVRGEDPLEVQERGARPPRPRHPRLSSLHTVLSGGAQVPDAPVRRIEHTLGVDFTIVYGQIECSPALTNTSPTDTPECR